MNRTGAAQGALNRIEEVSLCCIRIGDDLFAIETNDLREVLGRFDLRTVPLAPDAIAGILAYRGEVLTAVSFRALLGRPEMGPAECVLVLEDRKTAEHWGLVVDAVCGVLCLPKDSLEPNPVTLDPRSMDLFDGVYRTPNGLIVRIDPNRLLPGWSAAAGSTGNTPAGITDRTNAPQESHHARTDR